MEQQYIESAKEVAGKAIGKNGLVYITIIVAMGVGASIVLEESKMAAVMGLLGASLTALISMLNSVAGAKSGGCAIVPPGATYTLYFDGSGIQNWVELY
jgi:hypothetical protein